MNFCQPFDSEFPITQSWGEHPEDYARFGLPGHNGVDYGLPECTPVLAAARGDITKAGYDQHGYGKYVIVDHGGAWQTLYAHLNLCTCLVGDHVEAGIQIGYSGSTGNSTGPHLHFEVRQDGKAVDPAPLLESNRDRAEAQGDEGDVVREYLPGAHLVEAEAGLNLRLVPNRTQNPVAVLPNMTRVETVGDPFEVGGVTWVQVKAYVAYRQGENVYLARSVL